MYPLATCSKTTILTSEEIQATREMGESKTEWPIVSQNAKRGIEPEVDDDSPDGTVLMRATIRKIR